MPRFLLCDIFSRANIAFISLSGRPCTVTYATAVVLYLPTEKLWFSILYTEIATSNPSYKYVLTYEHRI